MKPSQQRLNGPTTIPTGVGICISSFCERVTVSHDSISPQVIERTDVTRELVIVHTILYETCSCRNTVDNSPKCFISMTYPFSPCFFSNFAHVSFSATVRLNTDAPGFESRSAQK